MHSELDSQAATLERVNNHVDTTQQGLANVQASAEKTLGKKGNPVWERRHQMSSLNLILPMSDD